MTSKNILSSAITNALYIDKCLLQYQLYQPDQNHSYGGVLHIKQNKIYEKVSIFTSNNYDSYLQSYMKSAYSYIYSEVKSCATLYQLWYILYGR